MRTSNELRENESASNNTGIKIGRFVLTPGTTPGKIWMTSPSGDRTEVDEKVIEDVLASFF